MLEARLSRGASSADICVADMRRCTSVACGQRSLPISAHMRSGSALSLTSEGVSQSTSRDSTDHTGARFHRAKRLAIAKLRQEVTHAPCYNIRSVYTAV